MGCRVGGCKELARVDMVGGGTNGSWVAKRERERERERHTHTHKNTEGQVTHGTGIHGNTEGLMYNLCVTEEQQLNDRLGEVKRGERIRGLVVLFSEDS
ncbi:unnamed protein product [Prunus armeniaca]|uniref:Uncharacterized protein n=1 Tax=Prunus armeniaca TaxID=36596 RepID=A0A6J5Y6A3_PRUAR|nr:unnamed protein product [Prunus armeniaca]